MKRFVLGLVAVATLMCVSINSASAGCHGGWGGGYHGGYGGGYNGGWGGGYRGGYGGGHCGPQVYAPPVTVYRPIYPPYGYGGAYGGYGGGYGSSFYYNGPRASFGFGF